VINADHAYLRVSIWVCLMVFICGNCSLLYYFISALIFFLDFSCLFYFASIYCYSISQLSKRNICFR
jgi:hypothetical protein